MYSATSTILIATSLIQMFNVANSPGFAEVLDRYSGNADGVISWRLCCNSTQEFRMGSDPNEIRIKYLASSIHSDGSRVSWSWRQWGGTIGTMKFSPEEKATYHRFVWDGQAFCNYRTRSKSEKGIIVLDPNPNPREVKSIRSLHVAAPLLGCYPNTYTRVDHILRDARHISLREQMEPINGVNCFVVEAKTKYGDYTLWIDPQHGYNIAKAEIHAKQEEKHSFLDNPTRGDWSFGIEISRFQEFDGIWVAMQGVSDESFDLPQWGRSTTKSRVEVTDLFLDPDHESLRSFARDDVVDGTWGWVAPYDQIKCIWQQGAFVPIFDHDTVGQIDTAIMTMLVKRQGNSVLNVQENAETRKRRASYPHCGLYCVYSMIGLLGHQADFQDLVKPEYLGDHEGSSLSELRRAARAFGLNAEPAGRLSTSGLSRCPYPGILHVRSHSESPKYDHYELFLGVEKGKARLFNPPETPRLVSFADLATRWDGKALFISNGPIETDLILAPDRRWLLRYSVIGSLVILAAYVGKQVWLSLVPVITRRWALGLSVGQAAAVGLAALLSGGAYHFFCDEGLLANAVATQSLQKGYVANFIPKVAAKRVESLLGTDTIFIDARLTPDYDRGHLNGAISLPVDANETMWNNRTNTIPKDKPIIVYCQSDRCKFAERVSARLIGDGFSGISIYRGGWSDWTAKEKNAGGSR